MVTALARQTESSKQSEFGPIPTDWDVVEAFSFQPFITSGSRGWARYYSDTGAPFIRITNLSHSDIRPDLSDLRFVKVDGADAEAARTRLRPGDVLISITADIGAVGYVGPELPDPAYINQHIACLRLPSDKVDSRFVAYFLASEASQRRFSSMMDVGAKSGLNLTAIGRLKLLLPPHQEQLAISSALAEMDRFITSLEALIDKKCAIKQAVAHELLSGRRRLPGYSGDWITETLGRISHIKTGSRNNQDKIEGGEYPFFVRSQYVERINSYSYDCEAILVPGEGGIGSIFHYVNGKFDAHQRVYVISKFAQNVTGKYIYLYMVENFGVHAMKNTVKATVDSLRLPTFKNFELRLPPTIEEQGAIARAIGDMDEDIEALRFRVAKAHQINRGMRQELLTGRVRLV